MRTKLGRNTRCWCGSGKKYKRCHLDRDAQQSIGKQEAIEQFHSLYEKGNCLHPNAGPSTCTGKIIKSHTIQRHGGLDRIAHNGHVYTLLKDGRPFDESKWKPNSGPNKVGTRKASTFTGFCARHDNELFAPLERKPFNGTMEQIALLGYRAICYELYMKERALAGSSLQRNMDKGKSQAFQWQWQKSVTIRNSGVNKAIEELRGLKSQYDEIMSNRCFFKMNYYVVNFDSSPEAMCNGTAQATHDFRGNRIGHLGFLSHPANWLTFSLIETDTGGAAIFSWLVDHTKSKDILLTLDEVSDAYLPHAIIRFMFEFFENTYFSPTWWDGLENSVQAILKKRQLRDIIGPFGERDYPRPDDCLSDDGIRAVNWQVVSRLTSFSEN